MPKVTSNTLLTPDESVEMLTRLIRWQKPFFFTKYGDGALECIFHRDRGKTCDGEQYTKELGRELLGCWISFADKAHIGDWFSMTSGPAYYVDEYLRLVDFARPIWLHFETVLLMRKSQQLLDFYRALKSDSRRKCFMGPEAMRPAAIAFGAEFVPTPMTNLHAACGGLLHGLKAIQPELLIWGAGMAGHIPVTEYWLATGATCVNLGSALDPIYRGKTRQQQLHPIEAKAFLAGVL